MVDNMFFLQNNRSSFVMFAVCVFAAVAACASARPLHAANTAVPSSSSASDPQQMLDFNIAGYGANGQKTWDVSGDSMDMAGDDVQISDITANLYGDETMVLTADAGSFDKAARIVHLKDNVRATSESGGELKTDSLNWSQTEQLITTDDTVYLTRDNMTATGIGATARPAQKTAKLEQDVVMTVEMKKDKAERMVITCDGPMELDYNRQVAVFEKNVRVEGSAAQGTLEAQKMTVTFNAATKQIEKLVAEGEVRIMRDENISYGDKAVVTAAEKKLVLTGRPKFIFVPEDDADASP